MRAFCFQSPVTHICTRVVGCGMRRFADSCVRILSRPADPCIDALRDRWMAPVLVAMRAERQLADVSAQIQCASELTEAIRRTDIAAHGLKICALPSCDKHEATVQQYKFCSACRSVWYCSAEHGALHWKEHKPPAERRWLPRRLLRVRELRSETSDNFWPYR